MPVTKDYQPCPFHERSDRLLSPIQVSMPPFGKNKQRGKDPKNLGLTYPMYTVPYFQNTRHRNTAQACESEMKSTHLRNDSQPGSQGRKADGFSVHPIDGHRSRLAVHHAEQDLHQRALTAARAADDADLLARPENIHLRSNGQMKPTLSNKGATGTTEPARKGTQKKSVRCSGKN